MPRLTPRQNELLHLLAIGRTSTQIARQLGISGATARTHLENIYEKLGVSSRTAGAQSTGPPSRRGVARESGRARSAGPKRS